MAARLNTISTPLRRLPSCGACMPRDSARRAPRAARSPSRPTSAATGMGDSSTLTLSDDEGGRIPNVVLNAEVAARAEPDLNPCIWGCRIFFHLCMQPARSELCFCIAIGKPVATSERGPRRSRNHMRNRRSSPPARLARTSFLPACDAPPCRRGPRRAGMWRVLRRPGGERTIGELRGALSSHRRTASVPAGRGRRRSSGKAA